MANYAVVPYSTGLKNSVEEALTALETKLETIDSTTNVIRAIGVMPTGRDKEQCVGYLIYDGA